MLSEISQSQIPYNFTYVWTLKHKINGQTKQKQTHRYKEQQTDGFQRGGVWGLGQKGEGIKGYKLVVTKQS